MNDKISKEIQAEQDHGRTKYGNGPNDLEHDLSRSPDEWYDYINDHNARAFLAPPMDRRQHLIKVAGLAVSAIEAFDRTVTAGTSDSATPPA